MIEDLLQQIDHQTVTDPLPVHPEGPSHTVRIMPGGRGMDANRSGRQRKKDRAKAKSAKQARKANRK